MSELAEFLKSERVKQHVALEAFSKRSGLSVSTLRVLEAGEFRRFGSPVLVRGFVKTYCSALGIDPAPLVDTHAAEIDACDRQRESFQQYGRWIKQLRRRRRIRPYTMLVVSVFLALMLFGGIQLLDKRARLIESQTAVRGVYTQEFPSDLAGRLNEVPPPEVKKEDTIDADRSIHASTAGTAGIEAGARKNEAAISEERLDPPIAGPIASMSRGSAAEVLAEENPPTHVRPAGGHIFSVEADAKCWVQVRPDGKNPESVMMNPGDKHEWKAAESMQIVIGNAGGVRMKWDEENIASSGKPGRVLRFRLPEAQNAGNPR